MRRPMAVDAPLAGLLAGGVLTRGITVSVDGPGALTLAVALLARASRDGAWVAVMGLDHLGVAALAERDVCLERWVLVKGAGNPSASVLGATVSGFDVVLVGSDVRLDGGTVRRLRDRLRDRSAVLVSVGPEGCGVRGVCQSDQPVGPSAGADVSFVIDRVQWTGLSGQRVMPAASSAASARGHGKLLARRAEVTVGGRSAAAALPRRVVLWLPGPEGQVEPIASVQSLWAARDAANSDVRVAGVAGRSASSNRAANIRSVDGPTVEPAAARTAQRAA